MIATIYQSDFPYGRKQGVSNFALTGLDNPPKTDSAFHSLGGDGKTELQLDVMDA